MVTVPEITPDELALGTTKALPPYDEIPGEFSHMNNKWNQLFNEWFFFGLAKLEVIPKEGIDKKKALTAISAHMRSFKSKHEHKEAGVAFLMSEWFEDAVWEAKAKPKKEHTF